MQGVGWGGIPWEHSKYRKTRVKDLQVNEEAGKSREW
jgi:hypothetical protein